MRDRLSDMIQAAVCGCAKNWADTIADHLLAEGVIVPPCKVGDKLYAIGLTNVKTFIVTRLEVLENDMRIFGRYLHCRSEHWICWASELGNNEWVYLTREEAEKALERREGE